MKYLHRITILTAALAGLMPAQQAPTSRALAEEWPEIVKVDGIEILHVQKNIYMLVGGGANITVQIGNEGVMLVDSGIQGQTSKIVAAVRHLTRKPLRYLINTSADSEHSGGNEGTVKAAGGIAGVVAGATGHPPNVGITTISHENASTRMMTGGPDLPITGDGIPVSTFFGPRKDFYANDEPVVVLHQPRAHTDGDVIVFFRGSDVISTGDIFRTDGYPGIATAKGGTYQGELDALNTLLEITVPERNQMGGTRVIPGHGRICNEADVVEYRDMLTIIRDRVRDMVKEHMTLAGVKAARPTLEYEAIYGRRPEMTGDKLIEIIYNEITNGK